MRSRKQITKDANYMSKRVIALGSFDGLHSGHMKVLEQALDLSGYAPAVMLLEPQPSQVVRSERPKLLISDSEKIKRLEAMGFDLFTIDFTKIRACSPEEFFEKVLIDELEAGALSCGFNYRFGSGGRGDVELLKVLCGKSDMILKVASPYLYRDRPVSSTRIRRCLEEGDIVSANEMLGRPFSFTAKIVRGDGIGAATLGCATANQELPNEMTTPAFGVYATMSMIDGISMPSITNIGVRPTLNKTIPVSETHIIGFSGDIYGKELTVSFIDRIRDEIRFGSLAQLKTQLSEDIKAAQVILR